MRPLVPLLCLSSLAAAGCGGAPAAAPDAGAPRDLASPDLRRWNPPVEGPTLLSETGLYTDTAARKLAPGVRPFRPRWELWTDGADKQRYLYLPPNTKIFTEEMDAWAFPVGTRLWKEFSKGGRVVETRLLWKVRVGTGVDSWWMSAYVWNEAGTDAAATADAVDGARGTDHLVPSREDCVFCHAAMRDVAIGVSAVQLSGEAGDQQSPIYALADAGLLTHRPERNYAVPGTGTVKDTLGYLHGNCGFCHNGRAAFNEIIRFYLEVGTNDLAPEDTALYRLGINTTMNHTMPGNVDIGVKPGEPDKSQLYLRMGSRGNEWAMPPAASKRADPDGLALVKSWIESLPPK